jgi:uncharacterized membrane protein YeaQ/YmgE (transglycosylase-associated protein family)
MQFVSSAIGECLFPGSPNSAGRPYVSYARRWISRFLTEDTKMRMSGESLLIILMVGLVAGWLAGQILQGSGFGIIGDIVVGVVGAFVGSWLLPQLGIHLGVGLVAAVINATIGALILLILISLVRNGRGWRGG